MKFCGMFQICTVVVLKKILGVSIFKKNEISSFYYLLNSISNCYHGVDLTFVNQCKQNRGVEQLRK